jgi:methylphosphotriester-DNA--protein-cysteine methyltransferase
MGEQKSFEGRVAFAEAFLLKKLTSAAAHTQVTRAASFLFKQHGAVRIPKLGRRDALSLRQFERLFRDDVGMPPKAFARIARFQTAMDAKLADPARTWLDIAHSFGYYDQMHMIHDFELLGRNTPTQLLIEMGDVRPAALVSGGK